MPPYPTLASPYPVRLSADELAHAKRVAQLRIDDAKGPPNFAYRGGWDNPLNQHFKGCCGEIAVCHVLGVPWPASVNTYREPDIPPNWQVRHNFLGFLKVSPKDNPYHRAVLVMGMPPAMRVVGWMQVAKALNHYPLQDPGDRHRPAVFVPAADLEPLDA